jgi:glucose/mannose transport system substrate-binding protein
MYRRPVSVFSIVLVLGFSLALVGCGGGKSNKLEIYSWWTAGGEAEGLKALMDVYHKQYPSVEIVNATVAGGAGTNAKAVLATRLTGGRVPASCRPRGSKVRSRKIPGATG